MRNVHQTSLTGGWSDALREAAVRAAPNSRRALWMSGLAAGSILTFILLLLIVPSSAQLSSSGLGEIAKVVAQSRELTGGSLPVDELYPLAYPIWLLVVTRFTNDFELAARILSGLSAVVALFVAYQLCHGLANPERADEQACFSLLALALSPSFFLAAAGGAAEMPHLTILLLALLCIQRSVGPSSGNAPMALAGVLVGVSMLVRPVSLLLFIAVLLWLWLGRPFGTDEPRANLRPGVLFTAAFTIGAAPQLALMVSQGGAAWPWGPAELGAFLSRIGAAPLAALEALSGNLLQYVAADDLERLGAISGSWEAGAWRSLLAAIIALAPTIIKVLGLAGLLVLCWLERFDDGVERARLPVIALGLLVVLGSLGLVDARSRLLLETLLVVFAFASLPSVVPGSIGGVFGLSLVGLMVLHQVGAGRPTQLAPSFGTSDQLSLQLRTSGATPNRVMSANWAFYDTRSPWRERYLHVPVLVNSVDSLVSEMRRQGADYLVFDSQSGAGQWPHLKDLLDTGHQWPGLRALGVPLRSQEAPANMIAIYKLE